MQYNLPDQKFMRVATLGPSDRPILFAQRDGCKFELTSTEAGAEALAQCEEAFALRPGLVYTTLRRGTLEMRKNPFGDYLKIRWETSVVTIK